MNISSKQVWVFLTSIIFFATLMYIDFTFAKNNYLSEKSEDLRQEYISSLKISKLTNNLLIERVNNKISAKLLYDAKKELKEKENYRKKLYSYLSQEYDYLKEKGISLLHFHDNEGNSFLRFHQPKNYGDFLVDTRGSISKIIKEHKPISGVETGVYFQEFRTVYPMFYKKEYVGSVEISIPISTVLENLNTISDEKFIFLAKKDILDKTLNKESRIKIYTNSIFENFYINKNFKQKEFSDNSFEKLISSISHKLNTKKSFVLSKFNLLSPNTMYIFLPIKNINNEFIGYLVSKKIDKGIDKLILTQIFTFVFLALLLLGGILIYRRLQKNYDKNKQIFEQYQAVIDQSSIVSKADPKGVITYANKQFCKVSGYRKEELIGNSHNIIRHPDSSTPFFRQMWKTIKAKKIWNGVIKNRKKNGDDYYVQSTIAPILNEKNEIIEFIALREDITELMNQKNILRDEKDRINTVFNYIDEILIIRKEDRIEQVNKKFCEILPFDNLQEFTTQHSSICELFIPKEGYLDNINDGKWVQKIIDTPNILHKALIRDRKGILKTFWVKIQKISYQKSFYYLFSLSDITQLIDSFPNSTIPKKNEEKKIEKNVEQGGDLFKKAKESLDLPEDVINSLIDKFIISTQDGIVNLKNTIESKNIEEAKIIAHNIKGSAGTLSLDTISSLASDIEDGLKNDNLEQEENINKIQIQINELKFAKEIEL